MRHTYPSVALLLMFSSVAQADLRFVTHVEVRANGQTDKNPGAAAMMRMLMPPGDTVTFVAGGAVRIEQSMNGKRVVILLRSDGQMVLDPDARTYTRIPEPGDAFKQEASQPMPTFRRTGEFATIHGLRAERIEVVMPITLPVIPPAGFPTALTMTGDVWLSDAFNALGPGLRKALGLTRRLPRGLEGMVLRQILRSAEFGYEVESAVTELTDGPVAAGMFNVPEGYREAGRR